MVKVLPQASLQYFQIKNMVARSHGRGLPWKALQYKSSTIQWKRKYCAIKKEDVYGKNRRDDSPATESYRGGTKIEREPPKNLKLVLRAKYDNSILVKISPWPLKFSFSTRKVGLGSMDHSIWPVEQPQRTNQSIDLSMENFDSLVRYLGTKVGHFLNQK